MGTSESKPSPPPPSSYSSAAAAAAAVDSVTGGLERTTLLFPDSVYQAFIMGTSESKPSPPPPSSYSSTAAAAAAVDSVTGGLERTTLLFSDSVYQAFIMGTSESKPSPPPPSSSSSAAAAVDSVTGGLERMTLKENPDAAVIPREDTARRDEGVPRVDTVSLEDVQPTGWDEDEKPTGWEENAKSEKNSRVVPIKDGKGEHLQHPQRPGEPDCWFYLKTGSCRFGPNCKFNHPPRRNRNRPKFKKASEPIQSRERKKGSSSEKVENAEYKAGKGKQDKTHSGWKGQTEGKAAVEKESPSEREGHTECKNYAMTGGSKFGKASEHGPLQEKTEPGPVELNFLGLPIRPDKKECPYYMSTGGCKFAINCWYHHPNPTAVAVQDTLSGYQNSASLQQHASGASVVHMMTSSERVPIFDAPPSYNPPQGFYPNLEWNGYQVPVTPWLSPDMSGADITAHQQVQVDEYPERPGQPACYYFMKNGDCKFKSACKFHHPKTRLEKYP